MAILENKWSRGENIFVMIKTYSGYKRFKSNFLNFQSVSSIQGCLRKLIDFNDAWVWNESIMKQAAVDLNTVCCQGQRSKMSADLTEIQLRQHSVSLDGNIWPAITLALFPFSPCYLSVSASFSPSSNTPFSGYPSWYLTFCWLRVPRPRRVFLSPSRKIQYLSQSVWVHSPLSLGELPLALRWISLGLIDITLVMKYVYHDQRWW